MKKQRLFWIISVSCILLASCSGKTVQKHFFALDTFCTIKVDASDGKHLREMEEYVTSYDKMSRYAKGSVVDRINKGETVSDKQLADILRTIEQHRDVTRGYFDPMMARIIDLWDFPGGGRVPSEIEINKANTLRRLSRLEIAGNRVRIYGDAGIDLGGILKGVILDGLVDYCRNEGVKEAVINLGGDVALYSKKEKRWNLGVQDPSGEGMFARIECTGREIFAVTSGDYERYFITGGVRYHHILDPFTGFPSKGLRSLTVIADSGISADLLSTAWFAMGDKFRGNGGNMSFLALYSDGTSMTNMERGEDEKGGIFYKIKR